VASLKKIETDGLVKIVFSEEMMVPPLELLASTVIVDGHEKPVFDL
jgi:hypothetical protein